MPFILIIAGIMLLAVAVHGTQDQLFGLVKGDFTGPNNYVYWVIAILIIGGIGYVPRLKPISNAFLILVIVVLFLNEKNKGIFDAATGWLAQVKAGTSSPPARNAAAAAAGTVAKTAAGIV